MIGFRLALRALWWRRGLSGAVLAVAAVVVAVAGGGPVYDRAAKESVLQDALRGAPSSETGIDIASKTGDAQQLQGFVDTAIQAAATDPYGTPIHATEGEYDDNVPAAGDITALVAWREHAFQHLRVTSGRVPTRRGEVLASTAFLDYTGLRVGTRLPRNVPPANRTLTVVGAYANPDRNDAFWFSRPYFGPPGGGAGTGPSQLDALFTVADGASGTAVLDLPLRIDAVRVANAKAVGRAQQVITSSVVGNPVETEDGLQGLEVTTALPTVLDAAAANEHALGTPVLLVVLQLLLLCALVLFGAVQAAAEARAPEVALLKLRGFANGAVVLFGLAEPLLLVTAAIPIGVLLAWLAVRALAATELVGGVPVVVTGPALLTGVAAAAGGALATVLAGLRIVRRPVSEQWRRASHRPSTRRWWTDAVAVALAAGGLVLLARRGGLDRRGTDGSSSDPRSLAAPALVALAVALVGSRVLPLACRALYARTRRRGRLGAYLAVRQVARRPATLGIVVLLVVSLALATFAVSAFTVAQHNRHDVAAAEVGAATVLTVSVPYGRDLGDLVDAADPSAHDAMAVTEYAQQNGNHRDVLGVQSERFAAVATWRGDYAPQSPRTIARLLQPPGLNPVSLRGSSVRLDVDLLRFAGAAPPVIAVGVTAADGPHTYRTASLQPGRPQSLRTTLSACTTGCELTTLSLQRGDDGTTDLSGLLEVLSLATRAGSGPWQPVHAAFGSAGAWVPLAPHGSGYHSTVRAAGSGLAYDFRLPWQQPPALSPYNLPSRLPAVATGGAQVSPTGTAGTIDGLNDQALPLQITSTTDVLPRAGRDGVLLDRSLALRAANQLHSAAADEVWLAPHADPAVRQRLLQGGVGVVGTQNVRGLEDSLSREGPPLALLLFLVGAGVAAALALAGTTLSLVLSGRRRGFELAALSALGVSRRSLWSSLVVEQGTLLAYGAVLGVVTGFVGALIALPSVPEFTTPPSAPALLYHPPYRLVLGLSSALALAVVALVTVAAGVLVRTVSADRLRETAP